MSTTRFLYTNLLEASGAVLKNGTGGGAPALDEVAGYPMTNALTRDRYTVWQQSSGAGMDVDIYLGGSKNFTVFGFQNHRPTAAAGVGITTIDLYYQTGAYSPGGVWTAIATISGLAALRDMALVFAQKTGNSIRASLTVADAFTLGRFWLGVVDKDLGTIYMPGRRRTLQQSVADDRAPGGVLCRSWTGDSYNLYGLPFDESDTTLLAALRTVAAKKQSLIYLDHEDVVSEVLLANGSLTDIHQRPGAVPYDAALELVQLA